MATKEEIRKNINDQLGRKEPISVAFPPCSDVLLSLINTSGSDDITIYFKEYFKFGEHNIIENQKLLQNKIDKDLLQCTKRWFEVIKSSQIWPPPHCLSPSCVTLEGKRGNELKIGVTSPIEKPIIRRLFIADLIWLFYFERMGIFKILGVILDDFATKGKIPISNGAIDPNIDDDIIAISLEAMVRLYETGLPSTLRRRDSSYRRCLGWTSDSGRKLDSGSLVNTAFNTLFHKFIQSALEFYKDKRLATAIQATATPGKPSVATLITIGDTIDVLKKALDPFDYGRNYSNTLNGIVWVIASMALIREMRTTLGIPPAYDNPYEYIPAAYDILIMNKQITPSETNRYTIHKTCAENAREIMLDLQIVNYKNTDPGGDLEIWLDLIEAKIEGYRTAYRSLTGVDLGASGTPMIEQAV